MTPEKLLYDVRFSRVIFRMWRGQEDDSPDRELGDGRPTSVWRRFLPSFPFSRPLNFLATRKKRDSRQENYARRLRFFLPRLERRGRRSDG